MWLNKWSSYGKKICSFGIFGGENFNFKDNISHFNAGDSAICMIAFQWVPKKNKKNQEMFCNSQYSTLLLYFRSSSIINDYFRLCGI